MCHQVLEVFLMCKAPIAPSHCTVPPLEQPEAFHVPIASGLYPLAIEGQDRKVSIEAEDEWQEQENVHVLPILL